MLVSESDHEDLSEILEKVFPNAPEKMKLLHLIIFYVIPRDDLLTFWRSVTDVIIIISNNINLYSIGK
jgi:hypothetical protein